MSRIRRIAFAFACLLPGPAAAQQVALTVDLGKATFFEDEPIYGVIELKNLGSDTLWLPYQEYVALHLSRNGTTLPGLVLSIDYYPPPNWRGVPFAPGQSFYETRVLQDRWGTSEGTSRDIFIGHLAVGSYELIARFESRLMSRPNETLKTEAVVVHFDVRPRTPAEDSSFQEFARVRHVAWDLAQRPRYLSEVLALAEARVAINKADPYLPFLLRNGLSTAWAIGLRPDESMRSRITELRTLVAEAQKHTPSGAVIVDAIYSETPDRASGLPDLLRGSVAGRLAAERVEHPLRDLPH